MKTYVNKPFYTAVIVTAANMQIFPNNLWTHKNKKPVTESLENVEEERNSIIICVYMRIWNWKKQIQKSLRHAGFKFMLCCRLITSKIVWVLGVT